MTSELIRPAVIFGGEYDGHQCCTCCSGYCQLDEIDDLEYLTEPLWFVGADRQYLSDRYFAVRSDLLDLVSPGPKIVNAESAPVALSDSMTVPAHRPGPSVAQFDPDRLMRATAAGFTLHAADNGPEHLYTETGEHAGWLMPLTVHDGSDAPRGMTVADIPRVQRWVAVWNGPGRWPLVDSEQGDWGNAWRLLLAAEQVREVGE